VGVWLSAGLMCAAICWMLQGWMPASWALLGGFLAVMRLDAFSYWANSYYGGAVAATGGALVLGGLPRVMRHHRARDAVLMGLGLAILANSRPYEGLLLALPVAAWLIAWMLGRKGLPLQLSMRRIVLPLSLLLAVTAMAMLYYFWRTTGRPLRTPYQVTNETYNPVPYFLWQSLKPVPEYHNAAMRQFYLGMVLRQYLFARFHLGQLEFLKVEEMWFFFLGPVLTFPLLVLPLTAPYGWSLKSVGAKTRFLLLVCGVSFIGLALPIFEINPHYAAPLTGALYALILRAMRHLRVWPRRGKPTGLFMVRAVPSICVTMLLLRAAASPLGLPILPELPRTWCSPQLGNMDRARVQAQLKGCEGRQLAIVHYQPDHYVVDEWVYNEADIDDAKVVWARDMGPAQNAKLLRYFKDRHVWLVEPDEQPPKLSLYPSPSGR
jgi:hypothetical protein